MRGRLAEAIHRRPANKLDMKDEKQPATYTMASARHGTLYVGVSSNLLRRVHQHREGERAGFASRYGCRKLVWYELHADMSAAITREKQIKGGSRARKIGLIEAANPHWHDLYDALV